MNYMKKILNIITTVLTVVIVAFALLFVVLTLSSNKDSDGTSEIFNKQFRIITTNSMEKCDETDVSGYDIKSLSVNDMVFIELVPEDEEEAFEWYDSLNDGDVLTFKYVYTEQIVITHRLIEKEYIKETNSFKLYLMGDNKNADVNLLTQTINTADKDSMNYVIGKVVGKSTLLGNVVSLLKNPKKLILVMVIIIATFVIIETIKKVYKASKQEPSNEEDSKEKVIDQEIEELKKKIENLSNENHNNENDRSDSHLDNISDDRPSN